MGKKVFLTVFLSMSWVNGPVSSRSSVGTKCGYTYFVSKPDKTNEPRKDTNESFCAFQTSQALNP